MVLVSIRNWLITAVADIDPQRKAIPLLGLSSIIDQRMRRSNPGSPPALGADLLGQKYAVLGRAHFSHKAQIRKSRIKARAESLVGKEARCKAFIQPKPASTHRPSEKTRAEAPGARGKGQDPIKILIDFRVLAAIDGGGCHA